ncbi:histidinol-phosphate transaminase [Thioalkalivibrio sp. XN279]|uniref:histidinol-phosphate transaminase n=1 Tax=Thioalkalivibrio sp. XN279 TaxID=2714953 RepID=UPI001407B6DA|nr:histidinol-phosphate transaminase [Thioalkalivibrio sp. XN279]NHA14518.1 histidinol-phosphate transaminase [Thioalkalivibrio sp. XN279]
MTDKFLDLAVAGIQGLHPYQPGKPVSELEREYGISDIVKLASNENPLGPGEAVNAAIATVLPALARYPDANGFELKAALAGRHGLPPECITLGNGSNDVLVLLAESFLAPGLEAVYSRYAFAVYGLAVQATGAEHRVADALPASHPDQPLGHDLDAMAALIGPRTRVVFIANPNNPTGTWVDAVALERFLDGVPAHVIAVVDEAYFEYVDVPGYPDASQWLQRYPNLVVTRTFSKAYGLAGLRIGYGLSDPGLAGVLNRLRQPFNSSLVAQVAALAALGDHAHLARGVALNRRELARVSAACSALGLGVIPSVGNFILVDTGTQAAPLFEALLRRGVIVRPVGNYGLPQHLRISIGTESENDRLIKALGEVLQQ